MPLSRRQKLIMAVGGALFGNTAARGGASKALVEFRAGKMTLNTTSKMVSPDKRCKGSFILVPKAASGGL